MAWSRAWVVLTAVVLLTACARRLPAYRGALPPPLPRASSAERASPPTVPAPPGDTTLDLRAATSVGVRFEYDGYEVGPFGARQRFDLTYYHPLREDFLAALRDTLRGRTVPVGEANGAEDLLVTVVFRSMRVENEECTTVPDRRWVCSGTGHTRTCDWQRDSRMICWWPISLDADVLTARGGASGPVLRLHTRVSLEAGLAVSLREAHATLGRDVASLLRAGGLQ
ncbi:MAG: hypothetical protein U0353_06450 [Sandaracinus sp.]